MSIEAIGASAPSAAPEAAQKQAGAEEITTVTTHCDKQHAHDRSCPHTVSTKPAPRVGQNGYFIDKTV